MVKKKKHSILMIVFLPFRFTYRLLLSICITYSLIKRAIQKWIYRNTIDQMSGIEFEYFAKALLQQNGFKHVELTKASNDYGIDIFAMKGQQLYAIQCKKYKSKVGVEAIRQAATGCIFYDQDVPVVLTNSTFSSQAIKLAEILGVELWDGSVLQALRKQSKLVKKRKYFLLSLFIFIILLLIFFYNP